METIDGGTFEAAWGHWLEITIELESSSDERLDKLFVRLTGCDMVDLTGMKVTAEQASRVRHMAGPNYHAYIKATLAKHEGTIDGY
jgi:hypothetical protein